MSKRWLLVAALVALPLAVGCQHAGKDKAVRLVESEPCPPDEVVCEDGVSGETPCPPTTQCAEPGAGATAATVRPQDIQVNVPRQRVIVPRRAGCGPASSPGGQASVAGGPGRGVNERVVQTRQVVLMPQQVLVPFVQTTVSGPIRVSETQETTLLNLSGTTATLPGVAVAGGQVAVAPGSLAVAPGGVAVAGVPGGTGAAPAAGPAPAAGAGAGVPAAGPQNLADCTAQLRTAEQRITQLIALTETLAAQVEALKSAPPGPRVR